MIHNKQPDDFSDSVIDSNTTASRGLAWLSCLVVWFISWTLPVKTALAQGDQDFEMVLRLNANGLAGPVVINGNVQMPPDQAKKLLLMQMRGLIQNELSQLESICNLDDRQKQTLVDLAEEEWRVKTNVSVIKRTQQHVFGNVDLDSLAERITRDWLSKAASPDQVTLYDQELADRMSYRKKALISKMLDVLEEKLHLSAVQMQQIETVISERWRDRWYKSLEGTFDNVTLHPEIRPSWIAAFLSESQQAALISRDAQTAVFSTHHATQDAPSMELTQRFRVGTTESAPSIELDVEPKKGAAKKLDKELESLR